MKPLNFLKMYKYLESKGYNVAGASEEEIRKMWESDMGDKVNTKQMKGGYTR
jgi:hypothetical protein